MSRQLPKGWALTTLADAGTWGSGGTPKAGNSDYYGGNIPWAIIGDLNDGFIEKTEKGITQAGLENSSAKIIPPDSLLIAMYGSIGKLGINRIELTTNQAIAFCIPNRQLTSAKFLFRFFESNKLNLISLGKGGTQQNISQTVLKAFPLLLPPLAEQNRIVAKLDALMARSTRARDELVRIPRLIERYKQAVLAAAFSGKLTADWRLGRESRITQNTQNDDVPWGVPSSWQWQNVSEIGEVGLGRQRSPINHSGPHMRPYVRAANITWSGWDFSDVKEMNFNAADFTKFRLQEGDVLVNEGSGSAKEVGKPAIWRGQIENCCFQNTLIRVRPLQCTSEYLYFYFLFSALTERFVSKTQGVNIYHIGKDGLARYPIPIPSFEEQAKIVERLTTALENLELLRAELSQAECLRSRLENEILTKAFRGDLVPQDLNDEPASVLLARIRAERETARPQKTTRKPAKAKV